MKTCSACHAENKDEAIFCGSCGKKITIPSLGIVNTNFLIAALAAWLVANFIFFIMNVIVFRISYEWYDNLRFIFRICDIMTLSIPLLIAFSIKKDSMKKLAILLAAISVMIQVIDRVFSFFQ